MDESKLMETIETQIDALETLGLVVKKQGEALKGLTELVGANAENLDRITGILKVQGSMIRGLVGNE